MKFFFSIEGRIEVKNYKEALAIVNSIVPTDSELIRIEQVELDQDHSNQVQ